jgi:hypothetical protein
VAQLHALQPAYHHELVPELNIPVVCQRLEFKLDDLIFSCTIVVCLQI